MTDKERIEHIRIFLGLNKTAFSKVLGYTTPQSYTSYLNGSNNLSMKMIKALIKHDSNISIDWVLKGQGQMLLNNNNSNHQKNTNDDNTNLQSSNNKEVEYLQKEIEHLKTALKGKDERLKDKDERLKDKDRLISILEKNQK